MGGSRSRPVPADFPGLVISHSRQMSLPLAHLTGILFPVCSLHDKATLSPIRVLWLPIVLFGKRVSFLSPRYREWHAVDRLGRPIGGHPRRCFTGSSKRRARSLLVFRLAVRRDRNHAFPRAPACVSASPSRVLYISLLRSAFPVVCRLEYPFPALAR